MLGAAAEGWRRADLDVALLGVGRAMQAVAAVLLMVDPRDLGLVSQVRSPHNQSPTVYLYEAVPGGVGLSERLFERHDELVAGAAELIAGCGCESGCPACTGPRLEPDVDARALALRLLRAPGAEARRPSRGPTRHPGPRHDRRRRRGCGAAWRTCAANARRSRRTPDDVRRGGPGDPAGHRRDRRGRRAVRAAAAGLAGRRARWIAASLARRLAAGPGRRRGRDAPRLVRPARAAAGLPAAGPRAAGRPAGDARTPALPCSASTPRRPASAAPPARSPS